MSIQECDSCGASEWKNSSCVYCGSFHSYYTFLAHYPGVGLIGTWNQNGLPMEVAPIDLRNLKGKK